MVTLKNKKELNVFIEKIPEYLAFLIEKINEKGIQGDFAYFEKNIDEVQNFYRQNFFTFSQEEQDTLQQAFWAFCAKILMKKLGGELVLGTNSHYGTGTPIYINYGNRYDKKGKKKWMGIPFDSWFGSSTIRTHFRTLQMLINGVIEDYS